MNLYTVGCSFTHGHGPHKAKPHTNQINGITVNNFERYDLVWPWQLEPYFHTVINDAHGATGLPFACRRLYRFWDHIEQNVDNWIFVVQVSNFIRRDYLLQDTTFLTIAHQAPNGNEPRLTTIVPTTYPVEYALEPGVEQILFDYHCGYLNDAIMMNHHISDLLQLIMVLERLNARYLITGMTKSSILPEHIQSVHGDIMVENSLDMLKLIPTHNIIDSMCAHVGAFHNEIYHLDPCGHPNIQGHQIFSRYVLEQIQQRGWL